MKFCHMGVYFKILSTELNHIMFVNIGLKKNLPKETLEHKFLSPSRLLHGCGCNYLYETDVYREWSSTQVFLTWKIHSRLYCQYNFAAHIKQPKRALDC